MMREGEPALVVDHIRDEDVELDRLKYRVVQLNLTTEIEVFYVLFAGLGIRA